MSFRKKLYRYLGMKADMQAYARAAKSRSIKGSQKKNKRKVGINHSTSYLRGYILTFVIEIQVEKWGTK